MLWGNDWRSLSTWVACLQHPRAKRNSVCPVRSKDFRLVEMEQTQVVRPAISRAWITTFDDDRLAG